MHLHKKESLELDKILDGFVDELERKSQLVRLFAEFWIESMQTEFGNRNIIDILLDLDPDLALKLNRVIKIINSGPRHGPYKSMKVNCSNTNCPFYDSAFEQNCSKGKQTLFITYCNAYEPE